MSKRSPFTDLRVSFYFEPRADQPHAPDGPGFYLVAVRRTDREVDHASPGSHQHRDAVTYEVVPRIRIPNDEMLKIAKVLDRATDGKPLNWSAQFQRDDVSLEQAVLDAIEGGKEILAQEIANAEAAASRLSRLKKLQEEFGG